MRPSHIVPVERRAPCRRRSSAVDDALADAAAFVPVVNTEETYDTPTFSGVAFLTGINQEEELDRLVATLS